MTHSTPNPNESSDTKRHDAQEANSMRMVEKAGELREALRQINETTNKYAIAALNLYDAELQTSIEETLKQRDEAWQAFRAAARNLARKAAEFGMRYGVGAAYTSPSLMETLDAILGDRHDRP